MKIQNKKGVSNIIGYILLITITIIISTIVFQWMKSYVPTDSLECPEGVSVFIKDYNYDCTNKKFDFILKNNGRFDVGGYFIHGTNSSQQELATTDLTFYIEPIDLNVNSVILFDDNVNYLTSNNEVNNTFDFSDSSFGQIYSIEIIPVRYQLNKKVISCGNAKIKEIINCS
jgi:flagellin-like protein